MKNNFQNKIVTHNFTFRFMKSNKSEINYNRNSKMKVELDMTHAKKRRNYSGKNYVGLEFQGSRRSGRPKIAWGRTIIE